MSFGRRKSRHYANTPYTGVGTAPPNSVGVDPAALAAAASVSASRTNSISSTLSSAGMFDISPVFSYPVTLNPTNLNSSF